MIPQQNFATFLNYGEVQHCITFMTLCATVWLQVIYVLQQWFRRQEDPVTSGLDDSRRPIRLHLTHMKPNPRPRHRAPPHV